MTWDLIKNNGKNMSDNISFIYYRKQRKLNINIVHLWNGNDTFCNMFVKKQIYKDRYVLTDNYPEDTERLICNKCANVLERKMRDRISKSTA